MSEKSNLYVNMVIGNQFGHNPELESSLFKNSIGNSDDLFGDLGGDMEDLKEIAIRIDDDLEIDLYDEICEASTVGDIQKIVAEAQIEDSVFDVLLQTFEPPKKEAAAHAATVPAQA